MSISDERAIAQQYIGAFPWFMVIWGLGGFLLWLALWPLAHTGLMLWWIPRQIAGIYTPVTLSWAPHHPMNEMGRYRDTRGWRSPVGTILTLGMEYHLVHHLFPSIPLNKTPAAYRTLKPLLEAEGVSLNRL